MKINYCLPIIKSKKEEIFQMIENYKDHYDYFEIWLDYIKDIDKAFILKVATLLQEKLIILSRRQNLEPIAMPLEKRLEIISLLSRFSCFVDLDISQKEELAFIKIAKIKPTLLLSYHNYKETESYENLQHIITEMSHYDPYIYKLAAFCNDETDALRLLQIQLYLKEQNKKYIILGMGKFGTIIRVFGTLWGNEMIFAPQTTDESSASGQLIKPELEKIFTILNK